MAIIDAATQFSNAQTVTGASAVLSANTLDALQNRDLGGGKSFPVLFQVGTAFAGLAALEMQIITADDAGLTTNVNVLGSTGAIPVAALTAAARFYASINPRPGNKGQRYIGCRYVPTGTGTAGTISAQIGGDVGDFKPVYPTSYSVA